VLAVPSGQATDRFGERRVMLAGAVLMALSGAVFAAERGGAAGLVLGSVVLGTGHLLSVVGQQAAVANTAGPGRFDTAFGYHTVAASLGQATATAPAVVGVAARCLAVDGGSGA
jgi:MFS family permease